MKIISDLIHETEIAIKKIYSKVGNDEYGIIFPPYSKLNNNQSKEWKQRKIRRCEQELRFALVEQFLIMRKTCVDLKGWHYSVETPTQFKYTSAWKGDPSIAGSRSGKIDLTLYNGNKTAAFIEFKYGSLGSNNKNLEYDVIKLIAESVKAGDICRGYSVNLIEKKEEMLDDFTFGNYIKNAIENITHNYQRLTNLAPEDIDILSNLDKQNITNRVIYKSIVLSDK